MSPQEKKRLLEDLALHPGYLLLNGALQEQADLLQRSIVFERCRSIDDTLSKEYDKGKLEGRLAVEAVRVALINSLNIDIDRSIEDASRRTTDRVDDSDNRTALDTSRAP